MNKITYFKYALGKNTDTEISIKDFFAKISNGELKELTAKIRAETNKSKRNELKKKLPAVTVSGTFNNGRKIANFKNHSGLMQLDFDNVEKPNELKEQLKKDSLIHAAFISPSGNGVKGIVKISAKDKETHLQNFLALESHFIKKYKLQIDKACKDVSRLMFLCSDTELYVNNNSKTFVVPKTEPTPVMQATPKTQTTQQQYDNDLILDIEKVVNQITAQKIDITQNYNDWLSCGFAFADTLGERGRSYFHSISKNYSAYNLDRTNEQYTRCLKNAKGNGISPFFALARKYNIDTVSVQKQSTKKLVNASKVSENEEIDLLNTLIPKITTDKKKFFKEFDFYVKDGCYWYEETFKNGRTQQKRISNFQMQSLYNLDNGTNNSKRLIKLQKRGEKPKLIEVLSSEMKLDALDTILNSSNCSFKGNSFNLKSIWEYLMDKKRQIDAKEITVLGLQPENENYAFANGIITKENKFIEINNLGIVQDKKNAFYLPSFAPANIKNENYDGLRNFKYQAGSINFETWAKLVYTTFGINGGIGIMYFILSLFRDIVFDKIKYFPFLQLFGDFGVGKTIFALTFMKLFGSDVGTDLNTTSLVGLSREVTQRTNSLFYFKEYTSEVSAMIDSFVLAGYDGAGGAKGMKTTGNEISKKKPKSGIIFDGNFLPVRKPAVLSRLVILMFEENKFTNEQKENFKIFEKQTLEGNAKVTKEILKYRNEFKKLFSDAFAQNQNDVKGFEEVKEIKGRLQDHLSLLTIPYQILSKHLKFPFTLKELIDKLMIYAKEKDEMLNEIQDTTVFWQALEYANNSTAKFRYGDDYLLEPESETSGIIYIKYNPAYSAYIDYCKNNNYHISDKQSLRLLLTSKANTSFLLGNRGKTHTKKNFGSCYKFRYSNAESGILINKIELNMKNK